MPFASVPCPTVMSLGCQCPAPVEGGGCWRGGGCAVVVGIVGLMANGEECGGDCVGDS